MKSKDKKTKKLIGIIMGSDSDWETMKPASETLKRFGISHEVEVVSAHRTPHKMMDYAKTAHGRGLKIIIAGAGGAAHLPGMVSSLSILPVIGVPVETKKLHGLDSLLSIVQMPSGIPVATVAIGNAENAALLAVRMLAMSDQSLAALLMKEEKKLVKKVKVMNKNLKSDKT
jgi:5-(carboxyamino)imidazole ribonucleotide mutase